jgi:GntR family transcriptional regulator/MocR family aminotransferase
VTVLRERAAEKLAVTVPDQGLHLVAKFLRKTRDSAVVQTARAQGIGARALSPMYLDARAEQGLVLGFSGFDPARVRDAARRLCGLL